MDLYRKDVISFLSLIETGAPFYVFDTETTGLSPSGSDVIQFSAIKCQKINDKYEIVDEIDIYINPGYPIPEKIAEITGITNETVKNAPDSEEAATLIREFLGENPILVGYNSVSFDQKFMEKFYNRFLKTDFLFSFHLDVFKMAKDKVESPRKLINLAERAGVADKYSFHSSIDDAKATLDVLLFLLPFYKEKETGETEFCVTGIQRWTKSHMLDRIYINNEQKKAVYYDIPRFSWFVEKSLDSEAVIATVLKYSGAETEKEFLEAFLKKD